MKVYNTDYMAYIYICSLLRQFACSLNDKMCDG